MKFYTEQDISEVLGRTSLVEALRKGFQQSFTIPPRMHLDYENPKDENQNTLLLMPAVNCGEVAGVKIVNVSTENASRDLPSIHGIYYLLDATTGESLALFDAKSLTNWRTAAASALAADYLSKKSASSLLMIGTGSLAPFLIDAHSSVRPIEKLYIYGRTREKAEALAKTKADNFKEIIVVDDLEAALPEADIISSATLSTTPLVKGEFLQPGQHIDLVGAFRKTSRESDDEAIRKSSVFVDTREMAPKEAGDILIPLNSGVLSKNDIKADLFELCNSQNNGRSSEAEITLFKSVGHALEDLVAAELIYRANQ